jgi:hypothetical protein
MSKQHVFPDRLKHVLPRVHGTRQYGAYDHIRKGGKTVSEVRQTKENEGSIATSRVRRVCKPCNEGWLNVMEQACFPVVEELIRNEKLSLQVDDQRKLARIATSIAFVCEWISRHYISTTQEERSHFYRTQEPPPGWYVFIGRNASDLITPFCLADGIRPVDNGVDGPRRIATYTLAMGPVLLHVVSLAPDDYFDVDMYADKLGLAAIYPPTEWIAFVAMPPLDTAGVTSVRSYARDSFRKMMEHKR